MSVVDISEPDVKLLIDGEGVIREASVSGNVSSGGLDRWVGQCWADTVADTGAGKIESLLDEARSGGVSGFRQLNQRFPDGVELPIEYTAVWLGGPNASTVAIGRNLQTVAELQTKLLSVQEALERDYWKLRDVQTRYRQLFDASNEAVVLVGASDLRIIEANPAALRALGLATLRPGRLVGQQFLEHVDAGQRETLRAALARAREQGKAPGVLLGLGPRSERWILRASLIRSDSRAVFLLQLAPTASSALLPAEPEDDREAFSVETLVRRAPDPFAVLDGNGVIRMANAAFVEILQASTEDAIVGEPLERWLARPGMDVSVLVKNAQRLGYVRRFPITLRGALGAERRVELSACGNRAENANFLAVLVHEAPALPASASTTPLQGVLDSMGRRVGETPMRVLVNETVELVESHIIRVALGMTGGNRTAAAEVLGLSRQSLYAKLARYGFDGDPPAKPPS